MGEQGMFKDVKSPTPAESGAGEDSLLTTQDQEMPGVPAKPNEISYGFCRPTV